jgi:predicted nucleotide-binding protein
MKFTGDRLKDAVRSQKLVRCDPAIAAELIDKGEQLEVAEGSAVYHQGDMMRGVFCILSGRIRLFRDGNVLQEFDATEHFGIRPFLFADSVTYTVTATAVVETLLLRIDERAFRKLSSKYPALWKNVAHTEVERLDTQNRLFLPKNNPPKLFIGSSTEGLSIAKVLKRSLQRQEGIDVDLWNDVFPLGEYPLETLTKQSEDWDFAAVIWTPDDRVKSRKTKLRSPRDNLVFEAGLAIGRLGRERTFILVPADVARLKIPSDIKQLALAEYHRRDMSKVARLIKETVERFGPRTRLRYMEPSTIIRGSARARSADSIAARATTGARAEKEQDSPLGQEHPLQVVRPRQPVRGSGSGAVR